MLLSIEALVESLEREKHVNKNEVLRENSSVHISGANFQEANTQHNNNFYASNFRNYKLVCKPPS